MAERWSEAETLRALELRLLEPEVRGSADRVAELLHDDFTEFGRSGGIYTKFEIIEALQQEVRGPVIERTVSDLRVAQLGPDLGLVTYRIVRRQREGAPPRSTLRSSIWQRGSGSWRMRFHQGTLSA